jgi:hypothetical protein
VNHEKLQMKGFKTTLVSGGKPPYTSWTFLIIPAELAVEWGAGQISGAPQVEAKGSSGFPFRGSCASEPGLRLVTRLTWRLNATRTRDR